MSAANTQTSNTITTQSAKDSALLDSISPLGFIGIGYHPTPDEESTLLELESATVLPNEHERLPIISYESAENTISLKAILPANVGGYSINLFGAYTVENDLIAIVSVPTFLKSQIDASGASEIEIVLNLILSDTDVNITALPTSNFALKADLENLSQSLDFIPNSLKATNDKAQSVAIRDDVGGLTAKNLILTSQSENAIIQTTNAPLSLESFKESLEPFSVILGGINKTADGADETSRQSANYFKNVLLKDFINEILKNVSFLPVGTIISSLRATEPAGFLVCVGQPVLKSQFSELFSVIGSNFGSVSTQSLTHPQKIGDSQNLDDYFLLPDLRGRFMRGASFAGASANSSVNLYTIQSDAFARHNHALPLSDHKDADRDIFRQFHGWNRESGIVFTLRRDENGRLGDNSWGAPDSGYSYAGESETRPKNISVNFFVKY